MSKDFLYKSVLCIATLAGTPVWANSSLGGSDVMGREPGSFSFGIEGQKSLISLLKLKAATGTLSGTNGYDGNVSLQENTKGVSSEAAVARGGYSITKGISLFGHLGVSRINIKSHIDSDSGVSGGLGVRIVPDQASPIKIGISVQSEMMTNTGERSDAGLNFSRSSPSSVYLSGQGNSKDKLRTNRLNMLVDFSVDTAFVRPYFGVLFSYISGEYSSTISGNASGNDCPSGGGTCTAIATPYVYSVTRKVTNSTLFGGVVGFSINQRESIGFNLEYQHIEGTDQSFVGTVVVRF